MVNVRCWVRSEARRPHSDMSAMTLRGHRPAATQDQRACSLRTYTALFDHLDPLGGFAVHIGLEVLRRLAADGDRATLAHACLNFGIGEHFDNRGVELVDDRPRRTSWH